MAKEKKRGFFSWLGFNRQYDDAGSEPQAERDTDAPGAGGETDAPVAATAAHDEAAQAVEPASPQAQADRPGPDRTSAPAAQAQSAIAESMPTLPVSAAKPSAAEPMPTPPASAEGPAAAPLSTAPAQGDEPVPAPHDREHDAQRMAAEIVSLTEQVATGRDNQTARERQSAADIASVVHLPAHGGTADAGREAAVSRDSALHEDALTSRRFSGVTSSGSNTIARSPENNGTEPIATDAVVKPPGNDAGAPSAKDDATASRAIYAAATPGSIVDAAVENRQDAGAELTLAAEEDIVPRPTPDGERAGFFARLKNSLLKTRQNLGSGFIGRFRGKKIDDDLFEELEEQLIVADVGVETTRKIIDGLIDHADRRHLKDAEALYSQLRAEMASILAKVERPLEVTGKAPFVILMVGVNGVGKTTTIGKLSRLYQAEGKSVMLAVGDTFRAAAVEQLQVWGERNHIPVIAQQTGADSASVIFDAIQAAKSRGIDVLIADTAGRLQNKAHLMDELKKIVRVMKKLDVEAPHEVMLTLDASTGQNAVSQANLFNDAVGLTGIALTKLDGTAKGGVIFAVADRFSIPIRFIGVGEAIEDLRPFKADDFIEALFAREDS
ncbi:signal recognition particle-docking protein FtsY [Candidatus Sodalis endolongispinus]|uniref:Signal recognition particle receptor FtsY n=1 Tax=Candidatus Sodalis endolongispinus TaxID=2812662 RepID=A0ABS5YB40_9GAMM|nr:signal recognition particle-docking protein FtsY [Candidatus Sodalis endolongispinus]MBT9432192.1 signal recognition particle-docking protein FtsY [Candidatus Sodalis endolongispinus]